MSAPAPTCNLLTMPASATLVTTTIGPTPDVSGGTTIPEGIYVKIAEIKTTGNAKTERSVTYYSATCTQSLQIDASGQESRADGNVTVAGGSASVEVICPVTGILGTVTFKTDSMPNGKVKLYTLSSDKTLYRELLQQ